MKPFSVVLVAVILSVLAAYGTVKFVAPKPVAVEAQKENLFDRLQKTKTLRCAYITWSKSYFAKDPNTGKFEGIGYDMAMAAAKILDLKIDWVEEVGVGNMYEGLKTGRYDAICTPVWLDSTVAAHALPTEAAYFSPVYAYARGDDTRFTENDPDAVAKINNKDIRLVDVDGSNGVVVYNNRYPHATLLSMPGTMSGAEIIQQVAQKKADVTQQNPAFVEDFLKTNPGALKRITGKALMVYPTALFVLPPNEWQTKSWFDQAIISMKNIGTVNHILDQYDASGTLFVRPPQIQ
jgi:ABC-type amino acid transport substrate-binding protein